MSGTNFTITGNRVMLSSATNSQVVDKLPTDTYVICSHPEIGIYLERAPEFTLPSKLYGNTDSRSDRFIKTFIDRDGTTGILLTGTKGSGKSLELKVTCRKALALDIPVIIISSAYCGDGFNKFVQAINQPCVLVFDEFEKVYEDDQQEALLTLLDGTFTTKKLVIFTCNNEHKINSHMINRPGRIFYAVKYKGLEEQFIREYCEDKLVDKSKIEHIVRASKLYGKFNFDSLQALVEELNRYGEKVIDALAILNIQEEGHTAEVSYNIVLTDKQGEIIADNKYYPQVIRNPFKVGQFSVEIEVPSKKKNGGFSSEELTVSVYENAEISKDLATIEISAQKYNVKLIKGEPKQFNYVDHVLDL